VASNSSVAELGIRVVEDAPASVSIVDEVKVASDPGSEYYPNNALSALKYMPPSRIKTIRIFGCTKPTY